MPLFAANLICWLSAAPATPKVWFAVHVWATFSRAKLPSMPSVARAVAASGSSSSVIM